MWNAEFDVKKAADWVVPDRKMSTELPIWLKNTLENNSQLSF